MAIGGRFCELPGPRRIALAAALIATVAGSSSAAASAGEEPARPTLIQTHSAIHLVYDSFARSFDDGRLVIEACAPYGQRWRSCDVTVRTSTAPLRFVIRVMHDASGYTLASSVR